MTRKTFRAAYSAFSREALAHACEVFGINSPEQCDAQNHHGFLTVAASFRLEAMNNHLAPDIEAKLIGAATEKLEAAISAIVRDKRDRRLALIGPVELQGEVWITRVAVPPGGVHQFVLGKLDGTGGADCSREAMAIRGHLSTLLRPHFSAISVRPRSLRGTGPMAVAKRSSLQQFSEPPEKERAAPVCCGAALTITEGIRTCLK